MELKIYFRMRTGQATGPKPRQLQIRLTLNTTPATDYASGLYVRPDLWNQAGQLVSGRTRLATELNESLAGIEAAHRDILRELKRRYGRGEGPLPTAETIKAEWLCPGSTTPTLAQFFQTFVLHRLNDPELSPKTTGLSDRARLHVLDFLEHEKAKGMLLGSVSAAFGRRFYAWLLSEPVRHGTGKTPTKRMSRNTAQKHLGELKKCIDHAVDNEYLAVNPLATVKFKPAPPKAVVFLDPTQLDALFALRYGDDTLKTTLWWARLMCLTGMDYEDAKRYVLARQDFERVGVAGPKIYIIRAKKPRNLCEIPFLPAVDILFSMYPTGPAQIHLSDLNRNLRVIQKDLRLSFRFSSKICRKTAGGYFLQLGYRIEAVSKILGHSSIRTTQRHYVTITTSFMDLEIKRVREWATMKN